MCGREHPTTRLEAFNDMPTVHYGVLPCHTGGTATVYDNLFAGISYFLPWHGTDAPQRQRSDTTGCVLQVALRRTVALVPLTPNPGVSADSRKDQDMFRNSR